MMTFTDEQWFKIPLALRQRWWKETDYGRAQPSDELKKAMEKQLLSTPTVR